MRTTIVVDSATPKQVYNLTLAFQRTLGFHMPDQTNTRPTVTVAGSTMRWESPALYVPHAEALLAEFDRLERGVFGGPTEEVTS